MGRNHGKCERRTECARLTSIFRKLENELEKEKRNKPKVKQSKEEMI